MANLYTKTGDGGETSLVGGSRVNKSDMRVECYGTVDEMGSAMGLARSLTEVDFIKDAIRHIQGRLFSLAAEIASDNEGLNKLTNLIGEEDVAYLEQLVDKCTETTGVQTSFVVPGKNPASGAMHLARTMVRRCERNLLRLSAEIPVRKVVKRYVNRLSDAVYALARLEETLLEQLELRGRVEKEVRKLVAKAPAGTGTALTLEAAQQMAARAVAKAAEMGVAVVVAVVDEGGNTVLQQRMDGSFLGSLDVAMGKAYTANAFRMPTDTLGEAARPDSPLYSIECSNGGRIILFGGGLPCVQGGRVIGGLGISGGTVEEDVAIAKYALGDVN